ncbi:16S rRNA (uracil(1498)-N(3))-methyltransferase [Lactobacillus sp. S2-2]|uniref:16S rRNA (uracil(1498)-N(3))-methyltransferase n=1 Tax=Lactobacillus sp. S2-2 TaxID=2692917 RepID=UPI001F00ADED|nr:16S rRNA (uracil(1498)-N(3))-methyltransferase [Lactobacillus sp. S2-2]
MQHYFLNQEIKIDEIISIDSKDIKNHWLKVLRAEEGDQAEFVSNNQDVYVGELVSTENAEIKIIKKIHNKVELPVEVSIACGIPKNGKAELIVQKATELGAKEIIFVDTDWSIGKWKQKADKKIERLQKIAQGAAEQSHRNIIPKVLYYSSINYLIDYPADIKLIAYEESAKENETSNLVKNLNQLHNKNKILGLFGPEGGISPNEIKKLSENDFQLAGLGPRILRAETAPLYFLSAVSVIKELN